MLSVSAWYLLRKRHVELAKSNLKLALPVLHRLRDRSTSFIFGANQAIEVTDNQPLKLASMEGLWESTSCAPLYLVGWVDEATPDDDRHLDPVPAELPRLPGHPNATVAGHQLLRAGARSRRSTSCSRSTTS